MEGDGPLYTYAELLEELGHWQSRFDELNIAPGNVVGVRADYARRFFVFAVPPVRLSIA